MLAPCKVQYNVIIHEIKHGGWYMFKKSLLLMVLVLLIAGCGSLKLKVIDTDSDPIYNAKVEYTKKGKIYNYFTDMYGHAPIIGIPFKDCINYEASASGYYTRSGTLCSRKIEKDKMVKLYTPLDMFDPEFTNTDIFMALKDRTVKFLNIFYKKSWWSNSTMKAYSINLIVFKGNRYFRFALLKHEIYNIGVYSEYDIGISMFDAVIRKILIPLYRHINAPEIFKGYDITVKVRTQNFLDRRIPEEVIKYRFIMPLDKVVAYKRLEISGQELLNNSIILLNKERIELNLQ